MAKEQVEVKKRKVAWGITGAGDRIAEFLQVMEQLKKEYESTVEIQVFLSKAGETVLKSYNLENQPHYKTQSHKRYRAKDAEHAHRMQD